MSATFGGPPAVLGNTSAMIQGSPADLLQTNQLTTTATVAQNSQIAALLSNYHNSNLNAYSCVGKDPMKAIPLEIRFLTATENPNPQFRIINADDANQNVIIGSVLGLTGAYAFWNQPVSGFDSPNMSDQYGFNMRALQGFNTLVNYSPVVLTVLQIISLDLTQVGTQFSYNDLCYDSKYNGVNMNTDSTFTRYDNTQTIAKLGGLWPIGPQTNVAYTSYAGVTHTITLTFNATDSVRTFRMVQ